MRDAIRVFPKWIGRGMLTMFVLHDAFFLTAAVVAAIDTPPSIEATLRPYVWVWVVMIGSGAITGIIGTILRNVRLEVLGCFLMIGGLITYATAVMVRAHESAAGIPTTLAAAAIFLAAACAIGSRMFVMFAAIYLREEAP